MIIKNSPIDSMKNAFSIEGFNVVVTGGNRGIGFGISKAFAECGANVAILCRNAESGRNAVENLKKEFGGNYYFFQCDTSDLDMVKKAVDGVYGVYDHVDVLVNNAGITGNGRLFEDENLELYNSIIQVDLIGTTNVSQVVGKRMREAGRGGSIINMSSIAAESVAAVRIQAVPGYNVAKAGINQLTRYLAVELSDAGIRVNGIAPGPTHSDIDAVYSPQMVEMIENQNPLHRFGEPLEIGALCVFLASKAACHITGVTINHDGGMILVG